MVNYEQSVLFLSTKTWIEEVFQIIRIKNCSLKTTHMIFLNAEKFSEQLKNAELWRRIKENIFLLVIIHFFITKDKTVLNYYLFLVTLLIISSCNITLVQSHQSNFSISEIIRLSFQAFFLPYLGWTLLHFRLSCISFRENY